VGEAVEPAASDSDRPVDELPKVTGSDEVWRVSFGRARPAGRVVVVLDATAQDMLECDTDEVCDGADMIGSEADASAPDEDEERGSWWEA
jgi:hypothetical protein